MVAITDTASLIGQCRPDAKPVPFLNLFYLAAFEASLGSKEGAITPASVVIDAPVSFSKGKAFWSPQNYDRHFLGEVTVRTALEQSLNVPAVRIAQTVGVRRITQ